MRIWPAIEAQFGLPPKQLWLEDAFIVKYEEANGGQPGLGMHADDSEISFNLLLSDTADFEGGGTAFEAAGNATLRQPPPPRAPPPRRSPIHAPRTVPFAPWSSSRGPRATPLAPCRSTRSSLAAFTTLAALATRPTCSAHSTQSPPASSSGNQHAELPLASTRRPVRGEMLSHFGKLRHAGMPVSRGTRYILAGFVRAQPLAAAWREFAVAAREPADIEEGEGLNS